MPLTALKPIERLRHLSAHAGVEQQVFRGIAAYGKLRQHHHVSTPFLARCVGRADYARGVALDVADYQVELRHDATQPPRLAQSGPLSKLWNFIDYPPLPSRSH